MAEEHITPEVLAERTNLRLETVCSYISRNSYDLIFYKKVAELMGVEFLMDDDECINHEEKYLL